MPPKEAAEKTTETAPGQQDPKKATNDARRTYEDLGRAQALSSFAGGETESLSLLTETVDRAYRGRQYKAAADLLRAAEHVSSPHFTFPV